MAHDERCDGIARAHALGAPDSDSLAAAERHPPRCPPDSDGPEELASVGTALDALPLEELLASLSFTPERVAELARRTVERAEAEERGSPGGGAA